MEQGLEAILMKKPSTHRLSRNAFASSAYGLLAALAFSRSQ